MPTELGAEVRIEPQRWRRCAPSATAGAIAIGYRWMNVPESPPGLRPSRLNCAATYDAVRSNPRLGVFRPSMESSAITFT